MHKASNDNVPNRNELPMSDWGKMIFNMCNEMNRVYAETLRQPVREDDHDHR